MMHPETCPTRDRLAALAFGQINGEEALTMRAHIRTCVNCRANVEDAEISERVLGILQSPPTNGAGRAHGVEEHPPRERSRGRYVAPAVMPGEIAGYSILEELGRGGMGVVYRGYDQARHIDVAIKVLLEGPLGCTTARRRFAREVDCAAQLTHPNIVKILDTDVDGNEQYFVMEYICGWRLDEYLKEHTLSLGKKLRLFRQMCHALHHAHQSGVIHRDLKPSNILVDIRAQPKIVDFGLAKSLADAHRITSEGGGLVGTLPFISPEQLSRKTPFGDVRSDVYSLGVILYLMLTDEHPHDPELALSDLVLAISKGDIRRPSSLKADLDHELDAIVLTCLEKDPDKRYQSAESLSNDISLHLSGHPIEARQAHRASGLWKRLRRHADVAPLLLSVLVVIATTAILWWTSQQRLLERRQSANAVQSVSMFIQNNDLTQARSALRHITPEHAWEHELLHAYLGCAEDNGDCDWMDLGGFFEVIPAQGVNGTVSTSPLSQSPPGETPIVETGQRLFEGHLTGLLAVQDTVTGQMLLLVPVSQAPIVDLRIKGGFLLASDARARIIRVNLKRGRNLLARFE